MSMTAIVFAGRMCAPIEVVVDLGVGGVASLLMSEAAGALYSQEDDACGVCGGDGSRSHRP
jgi:hypothetical protein